MSDRHPLPCELRLMDETRTHTFEGALRQELMHMFAQMQGTPHGYLWVDMRNEQPVKSSWDVMWTQPFDNVRMRAVRKDTIVELRRMAVDEYLVIKRQHEYDAHDISYFDSISGAAEAFYGLALHMSIVVNKVDKRILVP